MSHIRLNSTMKLYYSGPNSAMKLIYYKKLCDTTEIVMHNYVYPNYYTCKFVIEIKLLQLVICITRLCGCSKLKVS